MDIRPGDFDDAQVQALLRLHVEGMHASSPPGTCFVLDLSGLKVPEITLLTAWDGRTVMGMGAIKDLGDNTGELVERRKPLMRTLRAFHLRLSADSTLPI